MDRISIVVPCFNEEEALPVYYREMKRVMGELSEVSFEILFVDDGSSDKTLEILKQLNAKDGRCEYLSFSRNFGKEAAIYAGLKHASGDYVATMDVDLQDPPGLLPEMYRILKEEPYDSVATRRATRTGEPKIRSFLSETFYKFINSISKTEIVNGARDYRLMKRIMVDAVLEMSEYNRFSHYSIHTASHKAVSCYFSCRLNFTFFQYKYRTVLRLQICLSQILSHDSKTEQLNPAHQKDNTYH